MSGARKFAGGKLVVATHNPGKAREIRDILSGHVDEIVTAADLDLPEPEETGDTFIANALLKARAAAAASGLPALADDSGLSVEALGGQPGVYSARWGGPDRDWAMAMARVQSELEALGTADRRARFVCALAIAWPDGHEEAVEGTVAGRIVWPPRGEKGFGYDPIFCVDGMDETFAEIEPEAKHAISHRADAFAKLRALCFD